MGRLVALTAVTGWCDANLWNNLPSESAPVIPDRKRSQLNLTFVVVVVIVILPNQVLSGTDWVRGQYWSQMMVCSTCVSHIWKCRLEALPNGWRKSSMWKHPKWTQKSRNINFLGILQNCKQDLVPTNYVCLQHSDKIPALLCPSSFTFTRTKKGPTNVICQCWREACSFFGALPSRNAVLGANGENNWHSGEVKVFSLCVQEKPPHLLF